MKLPHRTIALQGKGAGRWPTAEAVFADIMDIQRGYLAGKLAASPVHENPLNHVPRMSTGRVA